MIQEIILKLSPFIEQYGLGAVFVFSILEEVIAPIPSSLALMAAGFFLLPDSTGIDFFIALIKILIPASLGLTIGSMLVYSFAYLGGKPLVLKIGKWFGISWQKVEEFERKIALSSTDEWFIFGLRALPFMPNVAVSLVCGIIRYPIKSFIMPTFFGCFVRALTMSLVGWSLGEAYIIYAERIANIGNFIILLSGVIVLILTVYFLLRKNRTKID
ncbi:MAG: VTT domain-containing protein [Patescibacteria group bacterium]|nr:VTT domain-containing protein [Patescibacteria group bacterium]